MTNDRLLVYAREYAQALLREPDFLSIQEYFDTVFTEEEFDQIKSLIESATITIK